MSQKKNKYSDKELLEFKSLILSKLKEAQDEANKERNDRGLGNNICQRATQEQRNSRIPTVYRIASTVSTQPINMHM